MNLRSLLYLNLARLSLALIVITGSQYASANPLESLQRWNEKGEAVLVVVEPFIELHTGAGRGYPIHFVIEQGEEVALIKRRTNWYKVRSDEGKEGWVEASQLGRTLQPSGLPADLPSVGHGEYLKSRWRIGFTTGQLEAADAYSIIVGYRPFSYLGVEAEAGEVFDASVTGEYLGMNVILEPFTQWRFSPFVSLGGGNMVFEQRQKLAGEVIDNAEYFSGGLGAQTYLGRNFVVRAEYRIYSVSTVNEEVELSEWKFGFSSFF
ncbi:MAG: SH3 domain-containing protein [Ketobacteraceae bacterium]|nr:SH3 domain-containing protein [Ketobacteraceae bacterium]